MICPRFEVTSSHAGDLPWCVLLYRGWVAVVSCSGVTHSFQEMVQYNLAVCFAR